jgi:hypothetical protein
MGAETWEWHVKVQPQHSLLRAELEGHGVNGSTSVSKTESLGSNPSAPATSSLIEVDG